jgi:AcrR family transcriptional regulator
METTDLVPGRQEPERPLRPGKTRLSIRDAQKQMTRERLLEAALELFSEHGFHAVTIHQIMKRAHANRATFYLHFKNKLDIAWALAEQQSGAQHTLLFHQLNDLGTPDPAALRDWIERRIALSRANPTLIHVVNEAVTSEQQCAEEYCLYLGRIADRVLTNTLGRMSGRRRDLARSKFIQLIIMMDRYVLHTVHHRLSCFGASAVDAITEMMWEALFKDAAGA